jgi:branched-chain amino acid transport system substrate-binding protein
VDAVKNTIVALAVGTALLFTSNAEAQEKVKIGLVTTLSGPGGVMGRHQKDAAELALQELGGKLGGADAELIVGDDQQKPDVGRQVVDGMLKRDKVNFVTGVVFSNVLLAIYKPVVDAKAILVSASGGPSEVAGEMCSPYFFSTSWQNDQAPEAMGRYMSDRKIDNVVIMAPNYAAGKDMLAGFKRTYKGTIAAEIYTNFTQADYQSELSQIRAKNPKAVFVFYPGGLGIQFVKQYTQSGLRENIPLFSVYTQNETTIPALGDAAEGNYEAGFWSPDLKNAANGSFVAAFRKKYGYMPSEYAAASYDAIKLMDSGVVGAGGKVSDTEAVIRAMSKADISSVRGKLTFNNNHFPIQDYYLFKLTKDEAANAYFRKSEGVIMASQADFYSSKCEMKK